MKFIKEIFPASLLIGVLLFTGLSINAQFALPSKIPIWDANKATLQLHQITKDAYAVIPATAETETTKGIPQATTGGFMIGEKRVLVVETMLNKRLYDQLYALIRSVTGKPIIYAINTSDHGDHCFGNYLLPGETLIIQNEFCKENLAKNFETIKQL